MKRLIFVLSFILNTYFASNSFSQTTKMAKKETTLTNQTLYKVLYELKNYTFFNGDSTVLNTINLNSIEHFRGENNDVEVYLRDINQTIILYSEKKIEPFKKNL